MFWVEPSTGRSISYKNFTNRLSNRESYTPVVSASDPIEIFENIIISAISEGKITLLDPNFSSDTLEKVGYRKEDLREKKKIKKIKLKSPKDLRNRISAVSNDWTVKIFTSGTTGKPKAVEQSFGALTRSVRTGPNYRDDIWGFAYSPTHFAGIQVFFQAIFNLNEIVDIYNLSPKEIGESILEHEITHISSTPTFYRMRLQRLGGTYESVKRLTSGGEKFEPQIKSVLKNTFPNAEFRNVYALTEAGALLQSNSETFTIPERFEGLLKISEEGELLVHRQLLGNVEALDLDDDWYHTGDLVERRGERSFEFVGRRSDFVNVGGHRVNPHEVEQAINAIEGVSLSVVRARSSSVTGNILVADVQSDKSVDPETLKDDVRKSLSSLPPWKQPRLINMVKDIQTSRSGKRIR